MNITASAQLKYDSAVLSNQVDSLKSATRYSEKELSEMKQACDDFEAIFIKMMLDSMKATIPENRLIEKNQGEEYFEDMLYQEYAESMSHTDSFGISEAMYRQMTATQGGGFYS
jgi:flagellar protein FlgJ